MKKNLRGLLLCLAAAALFLALALFVGPYGGHGEDVTTAMRDAVLHDVNQVSLFGLITVNPGMISAFAVTAVLLIAAVLIRIFVIPKFQMIPGRFQLLLETLVGLFDDMARKNSPHRNQALGGYLFAAGCYVFVGTCFELFGFQSVTVHGHPVTLPAPLSDVNAAIAMGTFTYFFIMSGGIASNGAKGIALTLKEFSLPISMSFRLFGALLSGLLVTELVYYYINLSFVLPVAVGVMFTLLHALIQSYVLTMLTSFYYGEVAEPHSKKPKKRKAA